MTFTIRMKIGRHYRPYQWRWRNKRSPIEALMSTSRLLHCALDGESCNNSPAGGHTFTCCKTYTTNHRPTKFSTHNTFFPLCRVDVAFSNIKHWSPQISMKYTSIFNQFFLQVLIVKLRQGSGKDRQGMAVKAKGLKA